MSVSQVKGRQERGVENPAISIFVSTLCPMGYFDARVPTFTHSCLCGRGRRLWGAKSWRRRCPALSGSKSPEGAERAENSDSGARDSRLHREVGAICFCLYRS